MIKFTRFIISTRMGKTVLKMDIKVSKDKHIIRWVDRENLILDKSEVKPVKNR